jgi:Ca2+-binding RTX toxin-like protein
VDGRAVILDYGIKNADGSWYLASGRAVLNAQGTAIAAPSVADVLAQAHPIGQEWRLESFGFNPLTSLPVDAIGVRFADGIAVDYTVMVTDRDGSFYIWARNLDRALELQAKTGDYREFNLRGYEIDFAHLDEVGSTDDSSYRVELLTPAQFHFATSLAGIDFHSEMLTASADEASGLLSYAVRSGHQTGLPGQPYESDIKPMIELVGTVMAEYITVSRRTAVRLALMGGLKEFAQGIAYDVKKNGYHATTDRELAPLFEAIFAAAPPNNLNDAALDYLSDWNEILWQIYPEYQMKGDGNLWGSTVAIDQPFIFQMMLPAFENVGIALDIYATAHALSIDETRIRLHTTTDATAAGTTGVDYFFMSAGNQTYDGGYGSDYYFVGKNNGQDLLKDIDRGDVDELRITAFKFTEAKGVRDGQDLILQFGDGSNAVRIQNQFLGELNDYLTNGTQLQSGVDTIVFADGIIWDRTRMALEVVDRARAAGDFDDSYIASGSSDILWGGKGNDYLSGGAGGDFYVFERGDGQDVINELGSVSFGPMKAGLDWLRFNGDIGTDDLKLIRDGDSEDLKIVVLDNQGHETNDSIEIIGQFGGIRLNLGLFSDALGGNAGLDYVAPNLIEKFIFEDGSSLELSDIMKLVLDNAKSDGDDAIYGFLNDNTLDGGAGEDYLTGREGSDTYIFKRGYGADVIEDADYSSKWFAPPQQDILQFA